MDLASVKRKTKEMRMATARGNSFTLPEELVGEILSWMPAEYLWPLRCISKTWFRLIVRDPQFAKLHFDRCIQIKRNPSVIAERGYFYLATQHTACDKAIQLLQPFRRHQPNLYTVHGVCNGLICLSCTRSDAVYIWNPTINDHITILCPLTPSAKLAFGFHQDTNQYKVIKCSPSNFHSQVSVYTLGIDSSWRTVGEDIPCDQFSICAPSPVVNGVVHWFGRKTVSSSFRTIVGFDMKDESFQEIPTPNSDDNSSIQLITEIGGQLCMFCAHRRGLVQIWAMKEYGLASSWTKLYNFGLGPYSFRICLVGVVTHNGDVIVRKDSNKLFLCHTKTNSISSLASFCSDINDAHTYIGSIISPRLISGAGHIKTERILGR